MNEVITSRRIYRYGDQKLEYTIVKSKRRKTSEIIIDEDEIILRTPLRKSVTEVEKLIHSKIRWILNKQRDFRKKSSGHVRPTFSEGSTLLYLGREYQIQIIKARNSNDKIEFDNKKFIVTLGLPKNSYSSLEDRIKSLYEDWLYNQAKRIFDEKVRRFSRIIQVNPKKIAIKNLRNRWGSITDNKTINLNLNLIKAPEDVIEYIIMHELCHFRLKGHSHRFWTFLHKFVPNYEDKVNWLAVNGSNLLVSK